MKDRWTTPSLTIVIPALNEENAIRSTIKSCLAARKQIEQAGVKNIEIIVVSDGSSDRTVEFAQSIPEVQTIVFEKNQGYGAAIQHGFEKGRGNLLGFIDADGTCDPLMFAPLCQAILNEDADIALGSRMGPGTKMPLIRRIGNLGYSLILGWICGQSVKDTASGLRVIRRDALNAIAPLPIGLQFTPAMSARALLLGMRIKEIPMSYSERVGRSKLNVLRDGVRFLRTIISATLLYKPERLILPVISAMLFCFAILAISPVESYLKRRVIEDWMLYRFLLCLLCSTVLTHLVCAAAIIEKTKEFSRYNTPTPFWSGLFLMVLQSNWVTYVLGAITLGAFALVWPGITEYLKNGTVSLHWSRCVVSGSFLITVFQVVAVKLVLRVASLKAYHFVTLGTQSQKSTETRSVSVASDKKKAS